MEKGKVSVGSLEMSNDSLEMSDDSLEMIGDPLDVEMLRFSNWKLKVVEESENPLLESESGEDNNRVEETKNSKNGENKNESH